MLDKNLNFLNHYWLWDILQNPPWTEWKLMLEKQAIYTR